MQVKVKILGTVITAQYGTLKQGDILITNEAFAKHLVEDCAAAEYCNKPKTTTEEASQKPAKSQPNTATKSKKST